MGTSIKSANANNIERCHLGIKWTKRFRLDAAL